MTPTSPVRTGTLLLFSAFLLLPLTRLNAQDPVAEVKQALAENKQKLGRYQWIETTTISLKGEVKSRVQKQCFYGPDGRVHKQEVSSGPQQETPGGLRGKVVKKKKGELQDYMERAAALITQYVPPEPDRIQAARDADMITVGPGPTGSIQVSIRNFVKDQDRFALDIVESTHLMQQVSINSYLADDPRDVITMDVSFATLPDGVCHPAKTVLNAPAKNLQIVTQNSNYAPL